VELFSKFLKSNLPLFLVCVCAVTKETGLKVCVTQIVIVRFF
jgi:hypothetical protein